MNSHTTASPSLRLLVAIFALVQTDALLAQAGNWLLAPTVAGPAARYAHAAAADPISGRVVLFGGWTGLSTSNETWGWDGLSWSLEASPSVPPARRDLSLVADPLRGQVVLFGGDNGQGAPMGDTWTWSGSTWTQRFSVGSPGARAAHGGAWDSVSGEVLIFGGQLGPSGPFLDETWSWNGGNWVQRTTAIAPSPRSGCAMASDAVRGQVVLFGGISSSSMDDTWTWNGSSWMPLVGSGLLRPLARHSCAFAFDQERAMCIMTGGISTVGNSVFQDTWAWDGGTWSQIVVSNLPQVRYGASLVGDPARRQLVMFGGRTDWPGGVVLGETLLWMDGAAATSFGVGCAGSNGVPALAPQGQPVLGTIFQIVASNLPGGSPLVIGFFGMSRTSWGFYQLPVELGPQGMPGCFLLVAPPPPGIIVSSFASGGQCAWSYSIPLAPFLAGLEIYFQALVPDSMAGNPLGATVTNAIRARLGA